MNYKTAIADCDVANKRCLVEFRALRERVADLLDHDEEHSISAQLSELFWHDATFRAFNHARRTNTETRKNAAVALLLSSYLDNAYIQGEILAFSRLTDPSSTNPKRGVVSLPTAIALLREKEVCVTRETYVCYDGLPFDCEATAGAERAAALRMPSVGWMEVPPSDYSRWAHERFDKLSGKQANSRRRDDRINPNLIKWLEGHIDGGDIRKVRLHRNKVLAHPADRVSRGGGPAERLGLTLAGIDAMHKRLLEAGEIPSLAILGEPLVGTPIATPQYDQFEGFESLFSFPEDRTSLDRFWSEMTAEKEAWSRSSIDAIPV